MLPARTAPINFRLMVVGQIISLMGSELLRFSLSLYVLDLTGRADIFATLYALSSIPLILAPIGGAIADRFHRRNLMVLFDFTSSLLVLCFLFVLFSGAASIGVIGAVMVLLSAISSMYQPTVQASIPVLVPTDKLEQANGIVSGVGALAGMVSPVLGGVLYGFFGLMPLIAASCIAFFLSAVMEIFIQIPFTKRPQQQSILPTIAGDLREGIGYIVGQSYILKSMGLAALLNLALTSFLIIGCPIILRVTMNSSDTLYGIGMGLCQLSMIAGALCVGLFARRMHMRTLYRWLLTIGIMLLPLTLSLTPALLRLGYYPSFSLFFVCIVPIAMSMSILSIFIITLVQKNTPEHLLGKVMAIIMGAAQCATPLGQLMYGLLFEQFRLRVWVPAVIASAAMILLSGLARFLYRNEGQPVCTGEAPAGTDTGL